MFSCHKCTIVYIIYDVIHYDVTVYKVGGRVTHSAHVFSLVLSFMKVIMRVRNVILDT